MSQDSTDSSVPPLGPGPMRRNVEVKAHLDDMSQARQIAESLAAEYAGTLAQVDTYFSCGHGRLKLRETDGHPSHLIWYAREDRAVARTSNYCMVPVVDSESIKHALRSALGVRAVLAKRRDLYLWHNVRIHLDEVDRIGQFLELEAVLVDDVDTHQGHEQVEFLLREFGVSADRIVAGSYVDMGEKA